MWKGSKWSSGKIGFADTPPVPPMKPRRGWAPDEAVLLALDVGGDEFGDVVEDDDCGEEDDADEGDLVDALFELLVDVAADEALDGEKGDHASVQDGDGQEVEDAQVEADESHGADDGDPAGKVEGFMDLDADADGARKGFDRDLAGEEAVENVLDEEGVLLVELP